MAELEVEETPHNSVGRYVFKLSQAQETQVNSCEWSLHKEHEKRNYSAYTGL